MTDSKYVLCRPRGGLNDMLCQIEKCYRYCQRHKRTLLLDTSTSGIRDNLFRYLSFVKTGPVPVVSWAKIDLYAAKLSVFPADVADRIDSYQTRLDAQGRAIDIESEQILSFDLAKSYDEDLLIHERAGGGINSYWLLKYLEPTPKLLDELSRRLRKLPESYVSVHIRNTDLQTDHAKFLKDIDWAILERDVVVATDSGTLQDLLRTSAPAGTTFHFVAALDPSSDQKLHESDSTDHDANFAMFADLFALALAQKLYFTFTTEGRISGFSGLAFGLSRSVLLTRVAVALGRQRAKLKRRNFGLRHFVRFLVRQGPLSAIKLLLSLLIRFGERRARCSD